MSNATSVDVARKAGVSQSAVSRTFTRGSSVSAQTSYKVRKAANELNYRPNALARSLITGKSGIIALIVAYLDNQFYPQALERLSLKLKQENYHILVFLTPNGTDRDAQKVVEELMDYQVDGIITASVALSNSLVDRCRRQNIPVMLFNRHQNDRSIASVTSNNVQGAKKATEHLIETGHRRIAHITGWQGSSTGCDRAKGFYLSMQEHGMEPVKVIDGMYNRDRAMEATRELLDNHAGALDAIFVGNDHMAFAVMDVIRYELGLRIPEDISIVGYDDVPLSAWPAYDLTTVRQPLDRMVAVTVEKMMELVKEEAAIPLQVQIDGDLIVRSSTKSKETNV